MTKQSMRWCLYLWIASLTLAMTNIAAAESTYSPNFCEFSIAFPEEPYKTRRCEDKEKNRCYDQISYTQVFDLDATVNFRVICNPIGADVHGHYTPEVMKATLRAMTKHSAVTQYETTYREEEEYKQAGLVGQGMAGQTPTLYIAQIWIGEKSAFSLEAELIGDVHETADELFANVLKTVKFKEKEKEDEVEKEEE